MGNKTAKRRYWSVDVLTSFWKYKIYVANILCGQLNNTIELIIWKVFLEWRSDNFVWIFKWNPFWKKTCNLSHFIVLTVLIFCNRKPKINLNSPNFVCILFHLLRGEWVYSQAFDRVCVTSYSESSIHVVFYSLKTVVISNIWINEWAIS